MTTIGKLERRIEALEQEINHNDAAEVTPDAVDRALIAAIREAYDGPNTNGFAEVVVGDVRASIYGGGDSFVVEAKSADDGRYLRAISLSKEAVRFIELADAVER